MGLYYHHSNGFSRRALIMWIALVVIIIMMFISGIFSVGCPLEEYEALLEIKASCNGTSPPSWGKQRDCCLWEGVICNNSTEQVTKLHLSGLFRSYQRRGEWILYGQQSWQLNLSIFSSFRELQHLDLSLNYLTGPLSSTALVGLKKLKVLDLGENQLTGEIPTSLGYLTSLEVLDLSSNNLTLNNLTGGILTSLGYLASLKVLDLGHNHLSGSIPLKGRDAEAELQRHSDAAAGHGATSASSASATRRRRGRAIPPPPQKKKKKQHKENNPPSLNPDKEAQAGSSATVAVATVKIGPKSGGDDYGCPSKFLILCLNAIQDA